MAQGDHRNVSIGPRDFIIISANPIPGNELYVSRTVDALMKLGADVVYESMYDVHVSGHAFSEELKLILGLVKPKYFMPVHGEYRHLKKHAQLAYSMGMDEEHVCISDIGKVVQIDEKGMNIAEQVTAGKILVDGLGVGDIGTAVLRDRKHLSEDGLLVIVATIDVTEHTVIAGPDIVSRGFVYVKESEDLIEDVKEKFYAVLDTCRGKNITDIGSIKMRVREVLSELLYQKTKRKPMILPIIMDI
jgi:ribonuclease J